MNRKEEMLNAAIDNGEVLSIIYNGGSKPGSKREIIPIQSVKSGRVRARCYTSKAVKTFVLNKIELLDTPVSHSSAELWTKTSVNIATEASGSKEIAQDYRTKFEELGWLVSELDNEDEHFGLFLHRPKKVGKGFLKSASVGITFTKYRYIFVVMSDGSVAEKLVGLSQKPWSVFSSTRKTRNWKFYQKALDAFAIEGLKGPH